MFRLHIKKDHPDVVEAEAGTSKNNLATSTSSEAVKFTCKHCNELFGSSTLLFRHIKTHTELYANKCRLCGKGYVTPQSLRSVRFLCFLSLCKVFFLICFDHA